MLKIIYNSNIFNSNCDVLVNTINCVGVMGKGLAKEMARRYPEMLSPYKEFCNKGIIKPGILWLWKGPDKWILNFPTKVNWITNSRYEYVELGLKKFVNTYYNKNIKSIAFPMLGCNNGKLDKTKVLDIMKRYLKSLNNIYIEIYY